MSYLITDMSRVFILYLSRDGEDWKVPMRLAYVHAFDGTNFQYLTASGTESDFPWRPAQLLITADNNGVLMRRRIPKPPTWRGQALPTFTVDGLVWTVEGSRPERRTARNLPGIRTP